MTVHLEIRGVVQGVGFRWFVRDLARRMDLAGWVRNRQDGSVEVAASGEDDAIRRFTAVLERGPSGARVDGVHALPVDHLGTLARPFAIER